MKIGKRAKYTLRLMVGIGRAAASARPVSLTQVAHDSGISKRYLDQLSIALKNASLIKGRSGRGGGFTLARPADQIAISEILQAASGPIDISECVTNPVGCLQSEYCTCRLLWALIHHQLTVVTTRYTLADLLEGDGAQRMRSELFLLQERKVQQATRSTP